MLNRRDFCMSILAVPALTADMSFASPASKEIPAGGEGFPLSDYTPFGYLDNPYHSWNLHRSGVIRSAPGVGFGFYYPAGPGGYFDFAKNGVYEAHLRLGFVINGKHFWTSEDFRPDQLTSPYHSKNVFTYAFAENGADVQCTFLQVDENSLAAKVIVQSGQAQSVQVVAVIEARLGGSAWWGRDGLTGNYDPANDSVWIRSFAAGKVFMLLSDASSHKHFLEDEPNKIPSWLSSPANSEKGLSYYPKPLHAGLLFKIELPAGEKAEHTIVLARAENASLAQEQARKSLGQTHEQLAIKCGEDSAFWTKAPRLEGDWPKHWKHGWVYDFETLRMMVRRPQGIYKLPWDAMQIQAPRTVLAESSIDMWALSYADPDTAKDVFLGLFVNAPFDGVPCSREDGEMNMVAADGSECGTSISWCHPFFCVSSVWARTRDKRWLATIYPWLGRFVRWTLQNRMDRDGFISGKCSWETGMDASRRFLIQQPTGGELIEFLRLVELQAAMSHAAGVMVQFAEILGDNASREEWRKIQQTYADKTQTLWHEDWFYDYDNRNGRLVTSVGRDLGQVAPVFTGIASAEQREKMRAALGKFYADSMATRLPANEDWQDGLHWSSLVLPYIESLWVAGDNELVSQVIETIAERIYTSMDRRQVAPPSSEGGQAQKLGWPGVSCEVWGGQGAYGGEGYGWGAVLPGHILRSLVGFRDPLRPDELPITPNLPSSFMVAGKAYRVTNMRYREQVLDLTLHALDTKRVRVEGVWSGSIRSFSVKDGSGANVPLQGSGSAWQFEGVNRQSYFVGLAGIS